MAIESFTRREQKYVISSKQYNTLLSELTPYMRADKYGVNGNYTVTSLYFDNPSCKIYYETKTNYLSDKNYAYACIITQI